MLQVTALIAKIVGLFEQAQPGPRDHGSPQITFFTTRMGLPSQSPFMSCQTAMCSLVAVWAPHHPLRLGQLGSRWREPLLRRATTSSLTPRTRQSLTTART